MVHRLLAAALELQAAGSSSEAAAAQIAEAHSLPGGEDASRVASHANQMRLAARNAQDASLKLFLCCLLKDHPIVTMGVALGLGGDRFFTVFLPELGCE